MESTSKRCWNSFFLPSKYVHRCYFGIILLISNARISIFCFEIEADWFGFRNHVIRILSGATAFARNVDPDHSASLCLSGFVESCCLFTILKFLCWNKHLLAILLISWKVAALRLIYYFKPIMQQNIVQCLCISQTFRIFTFRRRSESLCFADVQNLHISQTFRIFTFRRRSESLHFADVQNLYISQTFRIFTFCRRSESLHFADVSSSAVCISLSCLSFQKYIQNNPLSSVRLRCETICTKASFADNFEDKGKWGTQLKSMPQYNGNLATDDEWMSLL